jgi:hypothetical protein
MPAGLTEASNLLKLAQPSRIEFLLTFMGQKAGGFSAKQLRVKYPNRQPPATPLAPLL